QGPTLGKRHCRRNSAGYGGFGVGISDSFFHKDEVSAKTGQLQTDTALVYATVGSLLQWPAKGCGWREQTYQLGTEKR
ncbi:MAG: hypothetical protein WA210_06120, partial [Burkholderiaceae bacterium]